MKKLMAISLITSSVLFAAGPIELGVVQSNTIGGITTATNGSDIKQGSVEIYGNSSVTNHISPLPNIAAVNTLGGILVADTNSTIEQGTVQISDSQVGIVKVEANGMLGGVISKNNSEISQGKWKIVDVHGTSSVTSVGQTNLMVSLATATNNSKITQGNIEVGSVDNATIVVAGIPGIGNNLAGAVVADGGSNINQGSITICGNTHLALCGN